MNITNMACYCAAACWFTLLALLLVGGYYLLGAVNRFFIPGYLGVTNIIRAGGKQKLLDARKKSQS